MVNVINNGYIDNVSSGIIVELPTYIDEFGLHPQKIGKLPDAIAAQCDRLGREYLLMVEAAATCNYELARQAMFLDPLVSNCKYPELLLKILSVQILICFRSLENIVEWRKRVFFLGIDGGGNEKPFCL